MEMGIRHARVVVLPVQMVAIILVTIIVQIIVHSIVAMIVNPLAKEDVECIVLQPVNQQFEYKTQ